MNNWVKETLINVCEFSNGLWTGKKPPFVKVGVIRNTNFTKDCKLDDSDIVILDVEVSQYKKRKLQYGDIILEKSGGGPKQPVGRVVVFEKENGEYSFSNFTSVIRIIDKTKLDFQYLHRFLFYEYVSGSTEPMQTHSTGIRNLIFDDYKEIEVPIPSLQEQANIVSTLDEAFSTLEQAKENIQKNIENVNELYQSQLYTIIHSDSNFEKSTLGKSCEFFNGKAHEKAIDENGKYIVVNSRFISSEGRIAKRTAEQMFPLYKDDIVLVMSDVPNGKALAKCFLIDEDDLYSLNQRICAIRSDKFEKKYLMYQLNRHKHLLSFNNGENQTNLRKDDILNTPLIVPPMEEQKRILEKLDTLKEMTNQVITNYQKKLDNIEELKKSILQKAFSGELKTVTAATA